MSDDDDLLKDLIGPKSEQDKSLQKSIQADKLKRRMAQQHNLPLQPQAGPSNELLSVSNQSAPVLANNEIQRLKGTNWATWKWQLQNVLDAKGLTDVLTGTEPRGSAREVATRQIISSSLDQSLICKIIHCQTAQQIWNCLRGIYENRTSFALTDLIGRMNSYRMNTLDEVENGVSEIQSISCQIQALGGTVDDNTIESAILRALPKSFASFLTSWTFLDADKRSLENLHAHIMRTVCLLRASEQSETKDKALAVRQVKGKGKNKSKEPSNQSDTAKKSDLFCRYCKKTNHVIKDCRKLAKKKAAEEKSTSSSDQPETPVKQDKESPNEKPPRPDDSSNARVAYGHVATIGESVQCHNATSNSEFIKSKWIADSGASFHMTSHIEWIVDYREFKNKISVRLGDSHVVKAHGKGFIETTCGILDPVFYLPDISENLFSVASCAKVYKIFALSTDKHMIFSKDNEELFRGKLNNCGVYEINFTVKLAEHVTMLSTSLEDWHDRLAHISPQAIKYMADNDIVEGMFISDAPKPKCEPCAASKSQRSSHPTRTTPKPIVAGQVLHFDTVGPMPERSFSGSLYYVLCKDSYSAYRQIFFVSSKADIGDNVKKIINRTKIETGNDVLKVITDNGTEYLNSNLKQFFDEKGILHHTSAVYTPEQNGAIERDIRTVAESARTLRIHSGLPKIFWAEAMATAVYTLNRVINSRNKVKTPFELWYNRKPSLSNIHKFGESAIVYIQPKYRDKLDAKGRHMVFVGYTDIFNTFRFIDPETHELIISSNAVFLNRTMDRTDTKVSTQTEGEIINYIDVPIVQRPSVINLDSNQDDDESFTDSQVDFDSPNLTFESTNQADRNEPSISSSSNNADTPSNKDEFQTPAKMPPENKDLDRMQTLRPQITKPNYMGWKINLTTIKADEDPQSFDEAMSRPDKSKWLIAINEELKSLSKCNVWSLVDRPTNKNIVSNRWVLRIKRNPDGTISRYRARLVARGFSQIHGLDYHDTYAPTSSMSIIRLLFSFAAVEELNITQFDVKTAFLYGDLEEEVFMSQPQGFDDNSGKVWKLHKSLYGLKQAPRQWSQKFTDSLLQLKLRVSTEDKCVVFRTEPLVIVCIYVDDGIVMAKQQEEIDQIINLLRQRFEIHVMDATTFLGFQISKLSSSHIILHQESYVNKIVQKFGFNNQKVERSPISPVNGTDDDAPLDKSIPYREMIGSLLYAAISTRIDIAFAVGKASRSVASPTVSDLQLVTRIFRYLNGEPDLGLSYRSDRHDGLVTYCDADYAGCNKTSRSTTGLIVMFGGAPIHWQSSRQEIVTTSSTEAETVSLCTAVKDSLWLFNFATELGIINQTTIDVYCDNTSAISLASNQKCAKRTKHLRARFAFLQEQVQNKVIKISHVKSNLQLADMLTKSIPIKNFKEARDKLMANYKTKVLFTAMISSVLLTPTSTIQFETIKPIIYQETDKFIDIGVAQYQVDYIYDNPCNILKNFLPKQVTYNASQNYGYQQVEQLTKENLQQANDGTTRAYVQTFIDACNLFYKNTWTVKINELLSRNQLTAPIDMVSTAKVQKRSVATDIILGTCVSNFILSIFEPLVPWSDYHKIKELKSFQEHEAAKIDKLNSQLNASLAIQNGMLDLIKQNARNIREQQRQITHLAKLSSEITWLSSYIQSRIIFASVDLRTIIDEYTHRRVATLELSELLNITDIREVDPVDTEFVSVKQMADNTIRFSFNIRLKSKDTHVYHIHSFRYWDNLTYTPTMMEYQGSRFVLYNRTANCSLGLEDIPERAIMEECSTPNYRDPKTSVWRSLITTRDIYKQDISTFKRTWALNYIYCFPFDIIIDGEKYRCPSLMFKLDSKKAFKIGKQEYKPNFQVHKFMHRERNFIEDIPTGHFNLDSIATSDVKMFERIQELTDQNLALIHTQETSITILKHGTAWWSTIIMVGILIIVTIILTFYNLHLSRKLHAQSSQVASDVAEMKTYERLTCSHHDQKSSFTQDASTPKEESKIPRRKTSSVEYSQSSNSNTLPKRSIVKQYSPGHVIL